MASTHNELAQSLQTAAAMRPTNADEVSGVNASHTGQHGGPAQTKAQPHWIQHLTSRSLGGRPYARRGVPEDTGTGTGVQRPGDASSDRVHATAADVLDALLEDRHSDLLPGPATAAMALASLHAVGTARTLRYDSAQRLWQSRRHPSAGGTHSLEPLLHAHHVDGLEAGWYTQSGTSKGDVTQVLVPDESKLSTAARDALSRDVAPAAVLYAVCDPDILGARYRQGSSLMWRDAGAFTMVVHLLAHAHGLTSTILGLCVELDQGEVEVRSERSVGPHVVGAVAIGGPYTGAPDV